MITKQPTKQKEKVEESARFHRGYQDFFRGKGSGNGDEQFQKGWIRAFFDNKSTADLIIENRKIKKASAA